jgi:hypothetical protein
MAGDRAEYGTPEHRSQCERAYGALYAALWRQAREEIVSLRYRLAKVERERDAALRRRCDD